MNKYQLEVIFSIITLVILITIWCGIYEFGYWIGLNTTQVAVGILILEGAGVYKYVQVLKGKRVRRSLKTKRVSTPKRWLKFIRVFQLEMPR